MQDLELDSEPALGGTQFIVAEPPSLDGKWLGAYFPDTNTIVLSPSADEAVALHEIGHAFYSYWANDLSERSAERFRKVYQGNYSPYQSNSIPWYILGGLLGTLVGIKLFARA